MPSVVATSSPPIGLSSLSSILNTLKTKIASNQVIYASDINNLIQAYNTFVQHNHTVLQYSYIAYGNANRYPTTTSTVTSSGVVGASSYSFVANSSTVISSADINVLINRVNNIRTHTHTINDPVLT